MPLPRIALGRVVSWRTRTNTADLYTFPPEGKTTQLRGSVAWQATFSAPGLGAGLQSDADPLGRGAASARVRPEMDYLLKAGSGLAGLSAQQDVEDRFNGFLAALGGTYRDASDGKTYAGQVGYLRVAAWDGSATYDGLARIVSLPFATTPGANVYGLRVTPVWQLLDDWTVAPGGDDADPPHLVGDNPPYIPLGPLLSWQDTAGVTDLYTFPARTTTMLRGEIAWQTSFRPPPPGRRYEVDALGVSAASIQTEPEWDYLIKASPGLSAQASLLDVEDRYTELLQVLGSSTGNLGSLQVSSSDGSRSYRALARMLTLPFPTAPGKTTYGMVVTMKAHLLAPFGETRARWGHFRWGHAHWV